jgi:carbonic anhydrase/acetyltransferase-like protein (isoleucine patch superfamily)
MERRTEKSMKCHGIPGNKYNPYAWILGEPDIGEGTWIGAFTLLDAKYASLKIGKGCDISSGTQILTHSTAKRCISERKYNKVDYKSIEIGDHVFIGTNVTILMGAKIGHHSIIAAGSVVPENMDVLPYSLVAGVPAKIKKDIKEEVEMLIKDGNEDTSN